MRKLLFVLALLASPAWAQDLPDHTIPIGAGLGSVGFKVGGPCGANQTLAWASSTTDPVCTTIPGAISLGTGSVISNAGALTAIPGTATTVLHGNAAGVPSFSAVALDDDVSGTLPSVNGGTGLSSPTANRLLVTAGASPLALMAAMTNGQLVVGSTGAAPTPRTISGAITLSSTGVATLSNAIVNANNFNTQFGATILMNPLAGIATPSFSAITALPFGGIPANPDQSTVLYQNGATGALNYTSFINLVASVASFSGGACLVPGVENVGCGAGALGSISSGTQNAALGAAAGTAMTSGSGSVFVGNSAGATSTNGTENIYIGSLAGYSNRGFVPGYPGGTSCNPGGTVGCRGSENVAIGTQAMYGDINGAYAQFNVCVGLTTCQWLSYGNENTAVGADAGLSWYGSEGTDPVVQNVAIGANALGGDFNPPVTAGGSCTNRWAVGTTYSIGQKVSLLDTGQIYTSLTNGNVGNAPLTSPIQWSQDAPPIGYQTACGLPVTGANNVAIGYIAMLWSTSASDNVCIGLEACYGSETDRNTGIGNSAIGESVLQNISSGSSNQALGFAAGLGLKSGSHNNLIGWFSGSTITTGSHNIRVGEEEITTTGITTGSGNVVIGNNLTVGNLSDTVIIGDGSGHRRMSFSNAGTLTLSAYGSGVLFTDSAGIVSTTGAMTNGQIVVGVTAANPVRVSMSGDATLASSGALTIANQAVSYAKIQNVANQRILGRSTAGSGTVEELLPTTVLDWIGATRGQILYRGAAGWTTLSPGTSGFLLSTNGAGADPSWINAAGTGTVTSVTCGTGLDGGTITGAGTCSLSAARRTLPTSQKFTSGSGTYTTPANTLWIEIKIVGAGGGGGGSGTTPGNGGTGGSTCWNTSGAACTSPVYSAVGGTGGGGAGGTQGTGGVVAGSGTCMDPTTGGDGMLSNNIANLQGGHGGVGTLGGNAWGPAVGPAAGGTATANSGGGGGGAASGSTAGAGSGGGAGATCRTIINTPAATYTYAVGAAGTAGTAGTSGNAGGAGGSGYIVVVEHYGT